MVKRGIWYLFLCMTLSAWVCGCDSSADRDIEPETYITESGMVAQTYVKGAMISADKQAGECAGCFELNSGEVHAVSDPNGYFELRVPEEYGQYLLLSKGGTVTDSQGNEAPAIPMLAAAGSRNITPVTTLAALSEALAQKIALTFDQDPSSDFDDPDVDIARANGVHGGLLQLAKAVETALGVLAHGEAPIVNSVPEQLAVVKKMAVELSYPGIDLTHDADIAEALEYALYISMMDSAIVYEMEFQASAEGIAAIIGDSIGQVLAAIPNDQVATEDAELMAMAEAAMADAVSRLHGNQLAFNPSDPEAQVIPFPNDLVWAQSPGARSGLVTLDPATAGDPAMAALYTAVNLLNIKGLSPNAFISIPLEPGTRVDPYSYENIRLFHLNNLFGVLFSALQLGDPNTTPPDQVQQGVIQGLAQLDSAGWAAIQAALADPPYQALIEVSDIEVSQDGDVLKVYPLTPLDPGARYLVCIEDQAEDWEDDFLTIDGLRIQAPSLYQFLKSEEELTGNLAGLEPLRRSYAPLYNYLLPALGIQEDDSLEIFTFTTADRTLSLTDFGAIGQVLESGADPATTLPQVLGDGLPYANITEEYGQIHGATALFAEGTGVIPATADSGAFVSFDITTLSPENQDQITVPYLIHNGQMYTDSVVLAGHGFTSDKGVARYLEEGMPVLAPDFPLHGDRVPATDDPQTACDETVSGGCYLTPNLGQDRVNFYQTLFDMTILLKNLNAGKFDINGDGTPDTPETVHYFGISLGAINGAMFASHNSQSLDKVVLNVGGANYTALIDQAKSAEITGLLSSFGLEKNSTEYFVLMGLLQTMLDPADPVYLADTSIKEKTLIQNAYMDTVVPNISNTILAYALGYRHADRFDVTDFVSFSPEANSGPGWYRFGGKPGMSDNWIRHGFVFNPTTEGIPEAEGYLNPDYLYGAYDVGGLQISAFLNN